MHVLHPDSEGYLGVRETFHRVSIFWFLFGPYSVRENTDQKNAEYWHFSHSVYGRFC